MTGDNQIFCVDVLTGQDDEQHEVTMYVRASDSDTLNDVTRDYDGVSFCPVADGVVPESNIDYELPRDRIDLMNNLRQLVQGF